jgi:LmbE family N-acetylglucosaminyl deacetylase
VRVLAIGAHPDDIELGCGAALLAHVARGDRVAMLVMTSGEQGPQAAQSRVSEQQEAARHLGAELFWGGFGDGMVPDGSLSVLSVESVIASTGADIVYTHSPNDTHQDHRVVAAASLAAARRVTRVLTYEAPTSRGFVPQMFLDVEGFVEQKLELIRAHNSQVLKNRLVDLEAVAAQARYRGFQGRVHYAEAFEIERFVWDLSAGAIAAPTMEILFEGVS